MPANLQDVIYILDMNDLNRLDAVQLEDIKVIITTFLQKSLGKN